MYFRKVLICNDKVHYLEVYLSVLRNTWKCSKYIYFSNIILSASTVFKNTLLRIDVHNKCTLKSVMLTVLICHKPSTGELVN